MRSPDVPNNSQPSCVRLSKSRIAAFEHCARRLWLQTHRPELARFDEATLHLFAAGHQIGALARSRYRDGILVAEVHRDIVAAIARTRQLIAATPQRPIFEAAFQRDCVVVRVDVLEPDGWGGWKLIEVKNSGRVKPYQLTDVATQTWVLRANGICVSSVIIRHVDRPLRLLSAFRPWTRLVDVDVSADVNQLVQHRQAIIDRARTVVQGAEPPIQPGRHCLRPFRCEFRNHCGSTELREEE
jgi:hypothetical protein